MIDTIITDEGRRQLTAGDFRVEFVSFTDGAAFYEADAVSGSTDAGERIYFEAQSLLQDAIAFESDDSGQLKSKPGQFFDSVGIHKGNKLVSSDGDRFLAFVSGAAFAGSGSKVIKASLDNFKKLRLIGSMGSFEDDSDFFISQNTACFEITDDNPMSTDSDIIRRSVDHAGDLFSDPRLSHLPNFKYLPPVNAPAVLGQEPTPLGSYQNLGRREELEPQEVVDEINEAFDRGHGVDIEFTETSLGNNLFCQFFEIGPTDVIKLDVIDFGSFVTADSPVSKHVFFLGKVFENSNGIHTFIHLFTLMFFDKDFVANAF